MCEAKGNMVSGNRGGSRNSLKGGGGFWARILRWGGLGSRGALH